MDTLGSVKSVVNKASMRASVALIGRPWPSERYGSLFEAENRALQASGVSKLQQAVDMQKLFVVRRRSISSSVRSREAIPAPHRILSARPMHWLACEVHSRGFTESPNLKFAVVSLLTSTHGQTAGSGGYCLEVSWACGQSRRVYLWKMMRRRRLIRNKTPPPVGPTAYGVVLLTL